MNVNSFLHPVEFHLCDDCISDYHPFESSIEPVILSKECSATIVKGSFSFSMNCIFTITNISMLMEVFKSVSIVTVFDSMFYNMFYSFKYIETLYFC